MAINILFLIDKLAPAGTQINLLQIVKHLDRNKFNPKVIALMEGGELLDEFKSTGIDPIVLKVKRVYGLSGFRAFFFLIRYMKREEIDIVQTHFLHADILGTFAAKIAGVSKIITARRDEGFWRKKRQLFMNHFLNRYADYILANSEAVKEAVLTNEKVNSKKVNVIYNGVDLHHHYPSRELRENTRESLGIRDEEIIIGMIANMRHEVKGHRILIKALSFLHKQPYPFKVLLIGDGPLRNKFEQYAVRLKVSDRILFLGSRRDINALMNASDLICTPSLSEGFSNTILEAMAVGKPVLASNVGGNPEIVVDGETGILVRPRHAEALAQEISDLLNHQELFLKMGEAGRKQIENHFSAEKMAKEYEAFYEKILEQVLPKKKTKHTKRRFRHGSSHAVRVMHIIWSLDLGGAEQVVVNLTRHLNRERFQPIVCCLNEKGRYASLVENEGIPIFEMNKKPKLDLFLIPRLVKLIKRMEIDLIHTHLFSANLWGRIAAKLAGVPVISTEHGMDTWRNSIDLALDQWLTSFNAKIVCVSEGVKKFYSTRNYSLNGKVKIIHNGIEIDKFAPASDRIEIRRQLGLGPDTHVVGIVGRLVPEKAHNDFIDAIKLLSDQDQQIRGLIIGEGKLLNQLKAKVIKMRLEDKIYFLGNRKELPILYQAMDVFVMSSLREGFPLTILEAMAAKVPIVATNVGGVGECIEHEKDGILVEPKNPKKLAEAIQRILTDQNLKEKLIHHANEKVRSRFSVQKMTKDHELLYEETLNL